MDDLSNDLRIIASERSRLDHADRAKIIEAANYFEETQRALVLAQRELIEANAHRQAVSERLLALKPPSWSMSSGWLSVTQTEPV